MTHGDMEENVSGCLFWTQCRTNYEPTNLATFDFRDAVTSVRVLLFNFVRVISIQYSISATSSVRGYTVMTKHFVD